MIERSTLIQALTELSEELGRIGIIGEVCVVGGAAMVLAFDAREATKDVDAIFAPVAEVRRAASVVARKMELPPDWLNDAAKGFASAKGDFSAVEGLDLPHLRVLAPTLEYMLAMKVIAARGAVAEERGDRADITFLIRALKLRTAEDVLAVAQRYYDPSRMLPRSHYLVDEILEELTRS